MSIGHLQTHLNLFKSNVLLIFNNNHEQYIHIYIYIFFFLSFQDFLYNSLLILFNNVLLYCKAINNDGNKCLLSDVNPKTMFLVIQKIPKAQNLKILPKKYLSDLVIKLLILFVYRKIFFY